MEKFTHLHVHSNYSMTNSLCSVTELVDKCRHLGMNSMALTDSGNMMGIEVFLNYAIVINKTAKEGQPPFKPIVGLEVYCAELGRKEKNGANYHLILLAKNLQGYRNLCKLSTLSYTEGFSKVPRIDRSLLEEYHEELIASSACLSGEVAQHVLHGEMDKADETVAWFKQVFGEDYYLELMRHEATSPDFNHSIYEQQQKVNAVIVQLAKKYDVKMIATNNVHFVDAEQADAHDNLLCINTHTSLDDPDRIRYSGQEWLKSPEEMAAIFEDLPEALASTQDVVNKVETYSIVVHEQQQFVSSIIENAEQKADRLRLEELVWEGAKKRYGESISSSKKIRIIREMDVIIGIGSISYFLMLHDMLKAAREEMGIWIGPGRGSAAGSIVNYCLGITDVDPIEYGLLFERFINPEIPRFPNIDIDVETERRDELVQWLEKRFGKNNVAHIIVHGERYDRMAVREMCELHGVSDNTTEALLGFLPTVPYPDFMRDENGKMSQRHLYIAYKHIPEFKKIMDGDDELLKRVLRNAEKTERTKSGTGLHACGIVVDKESLEKSVPLCTVIDKDSGLEYTTTQYDGRSVERLGLTKLDLLGLDTLTLIKRCVNAVKKQKGEAIDIENIPLDDAKTLKLFKDGMTEGVFQFGSGGLKTLLKNMSPDSFSDLVALNAMYRPNSIVYINHLIERKNGREEYTLPFSEMERILKDSHGWIVYQEQIMELCKCLANFDGNESDKLRIALGRRDKNTTVIFEQKFMEGGLKEGHDEQGLKSVWADIVKMGILAFNKSHAVCYTQIAYRMAYLKAHHPEIFWQVLEEYQQENR